MTKHLPKADLDRQEAIGRVAMSLYQSGFVFAKKEQYAPRRGTLMFHLWQGKKLTLRHQRAWFHFTCDLYEAHGRSGPVSGGYGEATSGRNPSDFRVPVAHTNAQYRRLDKLVQSLGTQERILLKDLIYDELQRQGALELDMIGFHLNGFKDESMARAAGVATVTCLLSRIADHYSVE